jgi:hypothetical protein
MAFDWLNKFRGGMEKEPNYAEKTLAAYRLGMRGKGSIVGVRIQRPEGGCDAVRQLPEDKIYHPDEAPRLPLPECSLGCHCTCVYRPVMTYEQAKKA